MTIINMPKNVVIRQMFNPADRRVVVMNNGEVEFTSRESSFDSFEPKTAKQSSSFTWK